MCRQITVLVVLAALLAACDDTTPGTDSGHDLATLDHGQTPEAATDMPAVDGRLAELGTTPDGRPADAAGPDCGTAMDATGVGSCEMILGTKWDGTQCTMISGCSCQGADCGKLFAGPQGCKKAYAHCLCHAMDAQGVGACKMILGYVWDGTQCTMISGCSCQGADCGKLFTSLQDCQQTQAHCVP